MSATDGGEVGFVEHVEHLEAELEVRPPEEIDAFGDAQIVLLEQRAGDDERALHCYRSLTETLSARGYPPYRLNVAAMDLMGEDGAYQAALQTLRVALDPRRILAPGRYEAPVAHDAQSALDVA